MNLQSDDGERYLHVGLTLKLSNQSAADDLKEHMPEIRSRILILLSNKHPSDLTSPRWQEHLGARNSHANRDAVFSGWAGDARERRLVHRFRGAVSGQWRTKSSYHKTRSDALLKGVNGEQDAAVDKTDANGVRPYNLATQERIVRGRMPTLEIINERFARLLRSGVIQLHAAHGRNRGWARQGSRNTANSSATCRFRPT